MEKGPEIINFSEKKKERDEQLQKGGYHERGKMYNFVIPIDGLVFPEGGEHGGGGDIPYPEEIPPGRYKCLGFDKERDFFRFKGMPKKGMKEIEFLVDMEVLQGKRFEI